MISVWFSPRNEGHVLVDVTTDYQHDTFTVDPPLPADGQIWLLSITETITVISGERYAHVGYKYIPSCRCAYPQVLDGDLPVVLYQNGGPVQDSIAERATLYETGSL